MKFCIIGCGEHAIELARAGACALRRVASLAGARRLLRRGGGPGRAVRRAIRLRARSYADIDAMLDAERPDAVALVVPVRLTCEIGVRILSRGVPLLLEKPPGQPCRKSTALAAAARAGGASVPHQVAFNRRYVPLVAALRDRVDRRPPGAPLQHVRYEMVRVNRRDPDFSTTAIHAIDAVRFITGADFAQATFRYQEPARARARRRQHLRRRRHALRRDGAPRLLPGRGRRRRARRASRARPYASSSRSRCGTATMPRAAWCTSQPGRPRRGGARRRGAAVRPGRLLRRGGRVPRRSLATGSRRRRSSRRRASRWHVAEAIRARKRESAVMKWSPVRRPARPRSRPHWLSPPRRPRRGPPRGSTRGASSVPAAAARCAARRSALTTRAS